MDRTRRIGIALDLNEPYPNHQEVFQGVLRYAAQQGGWDCVIDEHPAYRQRQRVTARRVYDGVIARATPQLQRRLNRAGIPLVSTFVQHHGPGVAGVYMDAPAMGRLAAEHLMGRGYRRFAQLYDPEIAHSKQASDGFTQRIEEEQLSCASTAFEGEDTYDPKFWVALEAFIQHWVSGMTPPIGVFINSPIIARMLVELCKEMGLHVPQDIAVLCLRDLRAMMEVPTQISAVQSNYEQVGYEAAALLDRLMDGESVPDQALLLPPRGIAARTSTDHFAVEDPLVSEALRYISAHLNEKMRVEDLAYHLHVSPSTLHNRFVEALGRGVASEVRRLRVSAARVMLADLDTPLSDIADRVGFATADVMGKVFRRELGISPSAYRDQLQQQH